MAHSQECVLALPANGAGKFLTQLEPVDVSEIPNGHDSRDQDTSGYPNDQMIIYHMDIPNDYDDHMAIPGTFGDQMIVNHCGISVGCFAFFTSKTWFCHSASQCDRRGVAVPWAQSCAKPPDEDICRWDRIEGLEDTPIISNDSG